MNARGILPAVQQVLAILVGGGTPSSHDGGYPLTIQTWPGGYPLTIQTWPEGCPPPPRPGMGYPPPSDLGWGMPPPSRPGMGYPPPPPPSRPGMDVAPLPTIRPGMGYPAPPPPPMVNRQTFPSINITFPRTTYAGGNYASMVRMGDRGRYCLVVMFKFKN